MRNNTDNTNRGVRLYNLLFPIWLLVFLPSYLWLLLIPANYLIDALVLWLSVKKISPVTYKEILKKTWKICLAGFAADLAGSLILLLVSYLDLNDWWWKNLQYPVMWNPFSSILGFIVILISISVSAALIYYLDKRILSKMDIVPQEYVSRVALNLAVFTAPYLFLIPSTFLYD
ncbi:MAG: hypothetical protein Q4D71_06370 [Oscillospiraceae bacterium]|nr:hypothetical protein [Oscillospiraceae bacterium]